MAFEMTACWYFEFSDVFDFNICYAIDVSLWLHSFKIVYFLTADGNRFCISMPDYIKISQTVAEIWRFNRFSIWRLSAILDF